MNAITREQVAELTQAHPSVAVSLYLPTHRRAPDVRPVPQEDAVGWKNLLKEADEELQRTGRSAREIAALLAPARKLQDDELFWQQQSDGLAAFLTPDMCVRFRLPLHFEPLAIAGAQFHITPLVPVLGTPARFYILALSQNNVRLLEGTRDGVVEVDLPAAPHSLDEALRFDVVDPAMQFHTVQTRQPGGRRGTVAMFHGHGVGVDDSKEKILDFCHQVDRGVAKRLHRSGAPLVLATVDYLAAIYRQANTHPHLVEAIITGNPDAKSADELRAQAWALVEPMVLSARDDALRRFRDAGTDRVAAGISSVLWDAADGRVDTLFIRAGAEQWGHADESTREVTVHESRQIADEELINVAVTHALLTDAKLYALAKGEMPVGEPIAAVLRY